MKRALQITFSLLLIATYFTANANRESYWTETNQKKSIIKVDNAKYFELDFESLKKELDKAPMENIPAGFFSDFTINIPLPDGSIEKYKIERTKLMEDGLAVKYPEIKTFNGYSTSTNLRRITLDYTYKGFHAMISSPNEVIFIDPINLDTKTEYIVYYKSEFYKSNHSDFIEYGVVYPEKNEIILPNNNNYQNRIGSELLTYRLAMSTTVEYSNYHGGTLNGVLSAVQTTMARVNSVYETELDVRLVLVENTDTLFCFGDPIDDPYSNNNGGTMLGQNQDEVDAKIGSANYDIGHVFSTGGGGIASYACVCGNNKAQGVTGSNSPVGDPFDIDYVAHEMGHQFSGSHTFDGGGGSCGGNREPSTAFEPGSGSTIMAYAGICSGDNLQSNSDAYFHVGSLVEMTNFIHSGFGRSCAVITATGNQQPQVNASKDGLNIIIPKETAFELTGEATDPDGDDLTYCWEEYDRTSNGSPASSPGNFSPLFRSWEPTTEGYHRTFPRMYNILNNNTVKGETYPFSKRTMKFRLTARDNKAAGGGVAWDETSIQIDTSTGPFEITTLNDPNMSLEANNWNHISWDVAKTDQSPINASNVDIYLSIDNGSNFDILLAENIPNIGGASVFVHDSLNGENTCRIKIKASNNIFFDINNSIFKIVPFSGTSYESVEEKISDFRVYPNPAKDELFISSSVKLKSASISNMLGQKLQDININAKRVDVSNLSDGIYFVTLQPVNGNPVTKRIIIK